MSIINEEGVKDCIDKNVVLGHSARRRDPRNTRNILMEVSGVDIIDPGVVIERLDVACEKLKEIAASNGRILFVCTKRIASNYIKKVASELSMPYVTERWFAGLITNFFVVKKMIRKNEELNAIVNSAGYGFLSKKDQSILRRSIEKKNVLLDGINKKLYRTPNAIVIVDIMKENIAVEEASKTGVPIFGLVDTNVNFDKITYPIPCNDDSLSSIRFVVERLKVSIMDGLEKLNSSKSSDDGLDKK